MAQTKENIPVPLLEGPAFATTHWSVILTAGGADSLQAAEALERLCGTYWYPVYAFVRRRGYGADNAQDLTQDFFAQLLARHRLHVADPSRGRFRDFLLACLRNFLSNEWDKVRAAKRGGGQPAIPFDELHARQRYALDADATASPDALYDRSWALTLLEQVRVRLRDEFTRAAKSDRFEWLQRFLPGEQSEVSHAELGQKVGLTASALRSEIYRFRQRYRDLLRHEIAQTVQHGEEIDDEIRYLIAVLSH